MPGIFLDAVTHALDIASDHSHKHIRTDLKVSVEAINNDGVGGPRQRTSPIALSPTPFKLCADSLALGHHTYQS